MSLKITEDTNLEKLYTEDTGNDPFVYTDFGGSYYSGAYVDWLIDIINERCLTIVEGDKQELAP